MFDFEQLLSVYKEPLDLRTLILLQNRVLYPSTVIKRIDWGQPWREYLAQQRRFGPLLGKGDYIDSHFDYNSSEPDLRYPSRTGAMDKAMNTFLALYVVNKSDFIDIHDLEQFAKDKDIDVHWSGFHTGMISLSSEITKIQLLKHGIILPEQIAGFYQRVADWQLDSAEKQTTFRGSIGSGLTFPYPSHAMTNEELPDIQFLPLIAQNLLYYLLDIPFILEDRQSCKHRDLLTAIQHLDGLTQTTLKNYLERVVNGDISTFSEAYQLALRLGKKEAQQVRTIYDQVKASYPELLKTMKVFQQHPQLIDRRDSGDNTASPLPNIVEARQRILKSGGSAPKRTYAWRLWESARSGTV